MVSVINKAGILKDVVTASMTSAYGKRTYTIGGKTVTDFHTGIDVKPITDVLCPARGKVVAVMANVKASQTPEIIAKQIKTLYSGNYVKVQFGDVIGTFAHLAEGSVSVKVGELLEKGAKLGKVGSTGYSTGAHLHFGLTLNGQSVDPLPYFTGVKPITDYLIVEAQTRPYMSMLRVLVSGLRYRASANGEILGYLKQDQSYPYVGRTISVGGYEWAQIIVNDRIVFVAINKDYNDISHPLADALLPPARIVGTVNGKQYAVDLSVLP
jgi:hypothetical protein